MKQALFNYGIALLNINEFEQASKAFDESLKIEGKHRGDVNREDILLNKGVALQKSGKNGYKKCWKEAADLGSKKAKSLLEQLSKNDVGTSV